MSESAQQRKPDRDVERPGRADGGGDPDVLLDIPKVSVDSIRLAVDGLDADLSLRARLANLLQLDAGVRVHLQGVELDINGVHAEAQLRVRLEQLMTILSRALDTIDNNPQIIEAISRTAGATIDDVNRSAQQLSAGAAEVTGSAQRSGDVLDQRGRQVADRPRPGLSRPGLVSRSGRCRQVRRNAARRAAHRRGRGLSGRGRRGRGRRDGGRSGRGPRGRGRRGRPVTRRRERRPPVPDRRGVATGLQAVAVVRRVGRTPRRRARRSSPSRRGRPCGRPGAACGRRFRAAWLSTVSRGAGTTDGAQPGDPPSPG